MRISDYIEQAEVSGFHYILLVLNCLVYALAAMNVMLIAMTLPSIAAEWGLNKVVSGGLLSAGYVGMFLGAIGFGSLADVLGRRRALVLTILLASVFTGLCSIAWNVLSMSLFRFLAGIGLGGVLPQPGVYVSEYIPARRRGRFLGLVETSWVYGVLLANLFPYVLIPSYGWRLTFTAAFIPLLLVPFILKLAPESLRYLELKGRRREALRLLERIGVSGARLEEEEPPPKRYSFPEAIRGLWTAQYRRRTFILWSLWAVLVYTYHGIFLWLPSIYVKELGFEVVKSLYWVFIITLVQIPGYYSATFLLDRVGRKPVLAVYLCLAGVGSILLGASREIPLILMFSSVISFFNLGSWAALYTYTPELYPTRIRGTGSGTAASIGRLSGILAPIVTGTLWATGGLFSAFTVFAATHLYAGLITLALGVETRGKALEDLSK